MFTVLLADDEIHILGLLEKLIDWESLQIKIIGKCQTGTETYEAIAACRPDIVVIDIKMPGMSGLEVVKRSQENGIFPNFILISGHKQFEYARSAIQYGVENYLVKPVNKQELTDNLIQIIKRIEKERSQDDYKQMLEQQIESNIAVSREHFLKMLFLSPNLLTTQSLEEINRQYGFQFSYNFFRIISVKPDTKEVFTVPQYQILLKQIYEFAMMKFSDYALNIYGTIESDEVIFLVNYSIEDDFACTLLSIFELLKKKFYSYCYITIGVSSKSEQLLAVSYQEARTAGMSRITLGKHRIIDYNGLSKFGQKINLSRYLEQIATYIDTLNIPGIDKLFQQLETEILPDPVSPSSIFDFFFQLLDLLEEKLTDRYRSAETEYQFNRVSYLTQIRNSSSKKELLSNAKKILIKELTAFEKLQYKRDSRYISLAKQYIYEHIDQNISLNDIAEELFINPSYFSSLFKRETGETFSNFVTEMRIQKAKELLKNLKFSVSDVSNMVGYQDSKYFSKVFQRYVGIKPSEFRKLYTS